MEVSNKSSFLSTGSKAERVREREELEVASKKEKGSCEKEDKRDEHKATVNGKSEELPEDRGGAEAEASTSKKKRRKKKKKEENPRDLVEEPKVEDPKLKVEEVGIQKSQEKTNPPLDDKKFEEKEKTSVEDEDKPREQQKEDSVKRLATNVESVKEGAVEKKQDEEKGVVGRGDEKQESALKEKGKTEESDDRDNAGMENEKSEGSEEKDDAVRGKREKRLHVCAYCEEAEVIAKSYKRCQK